MADKVRVYRLQMETEGTDRNWLALDNSGMRAILEELRDAEVGDRYSVTVEEWDRAEFDALPEWEGW